MVNCVRFPGVNAWAKQKYGRKRNIKERERGLPPGKAGLGYRAVLRGGIGLISPNRGAVARIGCWSIEIDRDQLLLAAVGDLMNFVLFNQKQRVLFDSDTSFVNESMTGAGYDEQPLFRLRMLILRFTSRLAGS